MDYNYDTDLPIGYLYETVSSDQDNVIVRANLSSVEAWRAWLQLFEVTSSQKFVVKKTYNELIRYVKQRKCFGVS